MGGGNQEVAASAGGVTDLQREDGVRGVRLPSRFFECRRERRIEQALDEAGRRVVAARGLALVATCRLQLEGGGIRADLRMQLKERLIDAAKLLGAEITE